MSKLLENLRSNTPVIVVNAVMLEGLERLLFQLACHHESQAKPRSEPCSKEYNAQLASHIRTFLS